MAGPPYIDFEKLTGRFIVDGPLFKGRVFCARLPDGTQFSIVSKDLEGIGAVLDALKWEAEVDVDMIQKVVIHIGAEGSFQPAREKVDVCGEFQREKRRKLDDLEDDIPF